MAINICKNPEVRIDIMVEKKYWPAIVTIIADREGSYFKEDHTKVKDREYVLIRDVKTVHGYELKLLFDDLDRFEMNKVLGDGEDPKIYILIKPRRKGKKYVQKHREEAGTGSEGGNGGEPADIQPGEDHGTGDSGDQPADIGVAGGVQLEMELPETVDPGADFDGDHTEFISEVINEVMERVDPVDAPEEPEEFIEPPEYY